MAAPGVGRDNIAVHGSLLDADLIAEVMDFRLAACQRC